MTRRQVAVLLIGVVAISWAAPLIRLADGVPAIVIAATRLVIAAPVMVAVAGWSDRGALTRLRQRDLLLLGLAGTALAAHFALWVASLQRTSVLSSVALVTMQPLFVAVGAWIFLQERPTRPVLAGIACGLVGAAILFFDDRGDIGSLTGNTLAVGGAIAAGAYLVAGRGARQWLSMPAYTATVYSVAALLLLGGVVASGASVGGYAGEIWIYLVLLAVVPQLIGHNAFNWALGSVPAAIVAVAILGEPVGAAILAFILLDETPTLLRIIGAGVIGCGMVVVLIAGSTSRTRRVPVAPE
jgi:drug/metabolite transporter (DMT)-like permease